MSNLPSTHDDHAAARDDDAGLLPDPMRVLVVEDDAFQAMAIRELITTAAKSPVAVTLAGSIGAALELIEGSSFDIVLLDLMLPDSTGIEGLHRMVQVAPRLPVMVLTGFGREELVVGAFEHGAQDYLIKGDGEGEELLRAMAFAIRRKAAELRRLELARRDPLTGLANRAVLLERMQRARHRADREKRMFAVLFVDLDGFKKVNDSMGHVAGDQVLRSVARCLAAVVRRSDTVARLGGDEFVIVAECLGSAADAAAVADKALQRIARPMTIDGRTCAITGSIGISLYPRDAGDRKRLLALADAAMYQAKQARPNRFVFASQQRERDAHRLFLATG
jgi:diguanylate cyclase (GGDEF)-like protein